MRLSVMTGSIVYCVYVCVFPRARVCMCICGYVCDSMQVRNVPQDVSRTMQHLQLFQEDCPYERDLRVSGQPCLLLGV